MEIRSVDARNKPCALGGDNRKSGHGLETIIRFIETEGLLELSLSL